MYRRNFYGAAFVRNWLVIGPFPNPNCKGFEETYGPEKDGAEPAKKYQGEGGEVAWKEYKSASDFIDCGVAIKAAENIVGYGACWMKVAKAQKIILDVGSDDGCKVWVNRELMLSHHVHRAVAPGQDKAFANLKAGWNELLFKDENGPLGWGFFFQVYCKNGRALDAEFSTQPPK